MYFDSPPEPARRSMKLRSKHGAAVAAGFAGKETVMRAIHGLILVLAAAGATGAARAVDGQGLTLHPAARPSLSSMWGGAPDGGAVVPGWRSRVVLGFASSGLAFSGSGNDFGGTARSALSGARLFGDYYFSRPSALDGRASGIRATSGLIAGPRLGAWVAGDAPSALSIERRSFGLLPQSLDMASVARAVPYVGVGYSDRAARSGWGFSADVGVMALKPSSGLRYGRGAGAQSVDDVARDLRLAPVLQLGASYAF